MSETKNTGGTWAEKLAQALGLKPQQAGLVKVLAVAVALGILFLNAGELFGVVDTGKAPPGAAEVMAPPGAPQDELAAMESALARNLERTLSLVEGAGAVQVSVNLETGPTVTPVMDTRTDKTTSTEVAADNSKREQETTNHSVTTVMTKSGGADVPAVMKKQRAQIAGVLVVAEGARSAAVRWRLHQAAKTALGVAAHRITVVPAEGR